MRSTDGLQGGVRDNGQLIPELRGLVPRSFEYLFKSIQREELNVRTLLFAAIRALKTAAMQSAGRVKFVCRCSYLEIFQEQICDLLNPTAQNLSIREVSAIATPSRAFSRRYRRTRSRGCTWRTSPRRSSARPRRPMPC